MDKIGFELFQDCDSHEVTILPRAVGVDGIGRYGDAVTLSEEAFPERGLTSVLEVLGLFRADPNAASNWSTDNTLMWDLYERKPRSIELEPSPGRLEATVRVLHYDNVGITSPCWFDEESAVIPLGGAPETFAAVASGAFARSKDFVWIKMSLWDVASYFCVYRDDRTALYHWFDWVRIVLPDGRTDAVTAWGPHRILDQESLRIHCRRLTVQSLQEFARRKEHANPNPNPRGSQVEDAGVADQRRVVVYQRDDPGEAFLRVYNIDSAYQEQVESGSEIRLPLDGPEEGFQDIFLNAFESCTIE